VHLQQQAPSGRFQICMRRKAKMAKKKLKKAKKLHAAKTLRA
jgi:hypothetical protein